MRVAVLRVGKLQASKFDYGNNQRVTLEDIDNPKSYVYLNLTEVHGVMTKWKDAIYPGNVLEVSLMPGTKNVNKFGQFTIIRNVRND